MHNLPQLFYLIIFLANPHKDLFDQSLQSDGIIDSAAENGVGFIGFSPLAQGLLTDRYLGGIPSDSRMAKDPRYLHSDMLTPQVYKRISRLNDLAKQRGESLSSMALGWILQNQKVTSVIVGASSPGQLSQNLSALHSPKFSDEECSMIDEILNIVE